MRSFASIAVLIVEDEALIRFNTAEMIKDAGFRVYEAADAEAAIRILELHDDIRIVFTDIHMPGSMDGLKLAHYVRGRWPPVRLVLTSGRGRPGPDDLPTDSVFLPKPYQTDQILAELTRASSRWR